VPPDFVDAICREITSFEGPDRAYTVFFGGGTPSLLGPDALARILDAIRRRFVLYEPEITIEANPDDVTSELAAAWNDLGINRVSLGVQSFDDRVLGYLGRRHNAACARNACEQVAARWDNWGMDLIFGADLVDAWEATLSRCVACGPKHVSTYGLTYEPGTPFEHRRHEAVDDVTWIELYRKAEAHLADAYPHYEISNYARAGYECRHNLIYWHNEEYAGVGPGAYSFLSGARSRNHADLEPYLAHPGKKQEILRLTQREIRVETVIQYMRLKAGLSKQTYLSRFGRRLSEDFPTAVDGLVARGLLEEDGDVLRPTARGFELNNEIGLALVDAAGPAGDPSASLNQPVSSDRRLPVNYRL
jgi:oxygen-independent coproporphyrinogen-3 oxidase